MFNNSTYNNLNKTLKLLNCTIDNCNLGECLKNGTCKCDYPFIGLNCDKIDECALKKCINVNTNEHLITKLKYQKKLFTF